MGENLVKGISHFNVFLLSLQSPSPFSLLFGGINWQVGLGILTGWDCNKIDDLKIWFHFPNKWMNGFKLKPQKTTMCMHGNVKVYLFKSSLPCGRLLNPVCNFKLVISSVRHEHLKLSQWMKLPLISAGFAAIKDGCFATNGLESSFHLAWQQHLILNNLIL